MLSRVALVGGTGSLGSLILKVLLTTPTITQITAVTRTSSSLTPLDPRVTVVRVPSYDDSPALTAAFRDHDVVISALSAAVSTHIDSLLVTAATKAGVERFMPSEYTLDLSHPSVKEIAGGTRLGARVALVERLADLATRGEIAYTTFACGGWLDWGLETGFLGFDLKKQEATLYDGGTAMATGCTMGFVAEAVGAVLRMPEAETRNRRIRIAEVRYSGKLLLGALEEKTGSGWIVRDVSTEQALEDGRKALERRDARAAYVGHVLKLNFDGSGVADFPEGLTWGEGLARKRLEEIVEEALERAGVAEKVQQ
jgi:uncharacterized protein YbjT (DUF2867 family)